MRARIGGPTCWSPCNLVSSPSTYIPEIFGHAENSLDLRPRHSSEFSQFKETRVEKLDPNENKLLVLRIENYLQIPRDEKGDQTLEPNSSTRTRWLPTSHPHMPVYTLLTLTSITTVRQRLSPNTEASCVRPGMTRPHTGARRLLCSM